MQCPLLTQSGRGAARSGVTNDVIFDPKCDILFTPDVVLGAGEAMRRREFNAFVGSTAVAWPLMARAQQSAMPVIGFLRSSTLADATNLMTAFRQGLQETGYVEGQNVATEYRFAENDRDKLMAIVKDFIHRPVAVIVGNLVAARAAKAVKHNSANRLRNRYRPGPGRPGH